MEKYQEGKKENVMKNLVKTRNWIIIILCLTIVCLGIGFAVLSVELKKERIEAPRYAVEFTKASMKTPVQGGIKTPTALSEITNSSQTINIEFNLYAPHDEIGYKIVIKNTGNMKAEIINLVEKPDYILDYQEALNIYPVKISHNDIIGRILSPGEEIELNIVAIFDTTAEPIDVKVPYQLSIITKCQEE